MEREEKKKSILAAAEEVFSKKGVQAAAIAEIARKAHVTDSVIYQYFKNKDDLLFSVTGERMREVLFDLEENLKGIMDAQSRVSKMIWFHLRYNELHPEYSRLLLLECRSHPDFYKSDAYELIRQYAGIMLRILNEGVTAGDFRSNVDMRLVRDMILGTLDFEIIGCLVTNEIEQASSDLESLMSLVLPMIRNRPAFEKEFDKPSRVLLAAEKVFAHKGFNKATVADVAELAQVSEGTVYEYFENKEDLLLSIPSRRFQAYLDALSQAFEVRTPLRKLRRLIRNHFSLYLVNRDFLKVFVLQIQLSARFYSSGVYEISKRYFSVIEGIIQQGKMEGVFREDVEPRVFRKMFFGTFRNLAVRWFVLETESNTDMMREIDQVTDLLSIAVLTDEALEESNIGRYGSFLLSQTPMKRINRVSRGKPKS